MEDFFEINNISEEARVSIVLNTFMYIDRSIDKDEMYTSERSN